jgi:hypothetical protein
LIGRTSLGRHGDGAASEGDIFERRIEEGKLRHRRLERSSRAISVNSKFFTIEADWIALAGFKFSPGG